MTKGRSKQALAEHSAHPNIAIWMRHGNGCTYQQVVPANSNLGSVLLPRHGTVRSMSATCICTCKPAALGKFLHLPLPASSCACALCTTCHPQQEYLARWEAQQAPDEACGRVRNSYSQLAYPGLGRLRRCQRPAEEEHLDPLAVTGGLATRPSGRDE